jgi:hypothetical protein
MNKSCILQACEKKEKNTDLLLDFDQRKEISVKISGIK